MTLKWMAGIICGTDQPHAAWIALAQASPAPLAAGEKLRGEPALTAGLFVRAARLLGLIWATGPTGELAASCARQVLQRHGPSQRSSRLAPGR